MERFHYQADRKYIPQRDTFRITRDQLERLEDPPSDIWYYGHFTGFNSNQVFPIAFEEPFLHPKDRGLVLWTPPIPGAKPLGFAPWGVTVWDYLGTETVGWVNVPIVLDYKLSQSTPGWGKLKKLTVAELVERRNKVTLREPRKPHYFPLKIKKPMKPVLRLRSSLDYKGFVPPVRRRHETIAAYTTRVDMRRRVFDQKLEKHVMRVNKHREEVYIRRMKVYNQIVSSHEARRREHLAIFERRMEKYKRRMDAYELWLKKQKLYGRKDLVFRKTTGPLPENPFISLKMSRVLGDGSEAFSTFTSNLGGIVRTQFYPVYLYWKDGTNYEPATKALIRGVATSISDNAWEAFPDLETKIIEKIYDKLNRNQVHLGNLVAERAQTAQMIVDLWKQIHSLILLKKGFLKSLVSLVNDPRRLSKKISNGVLAWKFGVEPLANDLAKALKVILEGRGDGLVTVRANSRRLVSGKNIGGCVFTGLVEVSMVCKATVDNDFAKLASDTGLLDPSQVLWEVTPWSFVVDWFIPIGNFIQSLTSTSGLSFSTGTKKIRLKGRFDFTKASTTNSSTVFDPSQKIGITSSLGGIWDGEIKYRTVLRSWPDSSRILSFRNPFSFWHGIESIALMIQKIIKK